MVAPSPTPQGTPPALTNDEGKLIIQGAIKDASAALDKFWEMWQEDRPASRNRAKVQSMVDGAPPKSPYVNRLTGNGNETLVNWGDGERTLHEECAPYFDLVLSNETLGTTPIDRDFADDTSRADMEAIIAEELTALLLEWPDFVPRKLASIMEFKTHGLSFDYHEDDVNWQWRTAGMEDFKIPRNTRIGAKNIKYCAVQVDIDPEDLFKKIQNPKVAKLAGWNVDETRHVIMAAAPTTPDSTNWEGWEAQWKDNNYLMSGSKRVCPCVYFFRVELDQTISMYLMQRDGQRNEFMYSKNCKFKDITKFLHVYMDNVGTNKNYHSIRGLAHRLYSVVQTLNRKINTFSDLVDFAASPIFQPETEADADEEATTQSGPFVILNPRWKIPEQTLPNYQQSVIPALQMFGDRLKTITSRPNARSTYQSQSDRTSKYQFQAELEHQAQLSDADLELYLSSWQGHWKEIVRRVCRKGYLPVEPGGTEVAEFYRRCKQRGVTPEAIHAVDWKRSKINRGLGSGSASARILQLDRLQPWYADLDPISQQKFKRMYFMAAGNIQLANELVPKPEKRLLPVDASLADVQNNQIMQGMEVPVRDGQNHVVIAGVRLQKIAELNEVVSQGGEPALLELVQPMANLMADLIKQLEASNQDDPRVRQMLQLSEQFNEMITNGLRHVQRLQRNAQREAEHNQGVVGGNGAPTPQNGTGSQEMGTQGGPGPDTSNTGRALEMSIRLQEKIDNLQFQRAKHSEEIMQSRRKFAQDMKFRDLKMASELSPR